jgi:hypothetical protein
MIQQATPGKPPSIDLQMTLVQLKINMMSFKSCLLLQVTTRDEVQEMGKSWLDGMDDMENG